MSLEPISINWVLESRPIRSPSCWKMSTNFSFTLWRLSKRKAGIASRFHQKDSYATNEDIWHIHHIPKLTDEMPKTFFLNWLWCRKGTLILVMMIIRHIKYMHGQLIRMTSGYEWAWPRFQGYFVLSLIEVNFRKAIELNKPMIIINHKT